MEAFCPNCSSPCSVDALICEKCGATFGEGAAWRPLRAPAKKKPSVWSLPFVAALWFAILGPLVPGLLVSLPLLHYRPVVAAFAMYPLAVLFGGSLAAL